METATIALLSALIAVIFAAAFANFRFADKKTTELRDKMDANHTELITILGDIKTDTASIRTQLKANTDQIEKLDNLTRDHDRRITRTETDIAHLAADIDQPRPQQNAPELTATR